MRGAFPALLLGLLAPAAASPATLDVPCAKMGGAVRFDVGSAGGAMLFSVTYPRNVGSYLGGFVGGTKDAGADVTLYLDTDADPKTGSKGDSPFDAGSAGSEYSIETTEIETSVAKDASGEWIQKPVLTVRVRRQDEPFDLPEGVAPKWEMAAGGRDRPIDWMNVPGSRTMRLSFPIAALGLAPGAKVRVTAVAPFCNRMPPFRGTKETTITLK